jgi:hypothetical protein
MKTMRLYSGNEVITFTQKVVGGNVIVNGDGLNGVSMTVNQVNSLWNGKRSLGWTSEKPSKAPKMPKWNFGEEGFNYDKYIETARENGMGYDYRSGGVNRFHVYKNCREKVYALMGATLNA